MMGTDWLLVLAAVVMWITLLGLMCITLLGLPIARNKRTGLDESWEETARLKKLS